MKKRLYRSTSNRMIGGVCGGIAEYFRIDPTHVRLAWVLLSIFSSAFPGIIAYIIAYIIIPNAPSSDDEHFDKLQ